jgi:hypothetical protein
MEEVDDTRVKESQLAASDAERKHALALAITRNRDEVTDVTLATRKKEEAAVLQKREAEARLELDTLRAETEELVKRAGAIDKNLSAALITLSDQSLISDMVKTAGAQSMLTGMNVTDVLSKLFVGTPLQAPLEALAARPRRVS